MSTETCIDPLNAAMKVAFEAKYSRDWNDPAGDEMKAVWSDAWDASRCGALAFTAGLPSPLAGSSLFVTKDGAIHAGALIHNGDCQVLRTTNPEGGLHTVFDIPVSQVMGHAPCGPGTI